MLSHRKDPRTVFKSYIFAAAGKMEGADFFFFSPGKVNLEEETILAWIYEMGEWVEKTVPFPDIVYNSSPPMTEKQTEIVDALNQKIPFTSHPIGDKWSVYNRIEKGEMFSNYLIPSKDIISYDDVYDLLTNHSKIIVKPTSGSQGTDISYIERKEEQYTVIQDELKKVMNKQEFEQYIDFLIKQDEFLCQPFIECQTKNGLFYDFRLHTQKDGNGDWVITSIYPRIAAEGIVANLSRGGYSAMLENFLKNEFGEEYYNVKRTLEQFALQFSVHFDSLYDEPLDELGIDIGVDKNRGIWIFEVNWRPGVPVLFGLEPEVARNMIRYACYLHREREV